MKRSNQILWGILLVGVGLLLALNAFGISHVNLFFKGWWTLFIIVPSVAGLVSGKDRNGNLIGLGIGVFLLLCSRGILRFDLLWKLLVPGIVILFGVRMILGSLLDRNSQEAVKRLEGEGGSLRYGTAVFAGEKMNFDGEEFQGAELNAVFGSVECDLRRALIQRDCVVSASAIFGGIDIFVPGDVNVKITSNSIFGGVSNKTVGYRNEAAPTLYIRATCLFGGVDVK